MGRLHCEYEDDILDRWHAEMEKQRSRSASYLIARREKAKLLPAAPVVKKVPCPSCVQSFDSKKSLSNHKRACSAPARVTHPPDRMTRRRVLNLDESDGEDPAEEVPPVAVDPKEREERWVDPLPEKLQFQQQVNKIAELKCKYSRANAEVRWYKDRKKLFSDGLKYTILLDKQSVTLIINNPDPDDSGKYTCKANGMPTNSFVTVEGPSIKYVFLTPLPNTMDIYRTKQGVLTCKLNSPRAPLVWQRDGKPIDVDDPRYQIENDAVGRFTLTIRVVERIDQGMWTATVNKDVNSKCQVSVVEEPRYFVETLKSQSANENENVTFECVVNDEDIDVEWFHGDAKIKMDGRHFKEERVGCHRRLLITNLLIEDQGQYKCTTKDDKTMAQLIVDPLKKFECEAGKQKQIKVPFEVKGTRRGDPKPILLRNGKPVDLSKMKDLVEVIINGTVANIVFKNPQKSEAGKWSLKLENTGGVSTEAAFELVVKGKPKTPKGPVDTLDVTSASCAFLRGANEKSQQLFDEIVAEMALRLANDEHETESSDVDEDEYVVESDDDIPAVEPKEREERWVDPLPAKLQFQQQVNKIAELKCKYSRANAKVHWYKGRKELFSDGLKYKILIDKQSITLIINNPNPDDSGKYSCEANGVPTNSFVTVEDSTDQQPLSSTARRSESRRPKSARKEAAALTPLDAMQCCSKNLTLPRPKNTERTASGSGRRRVGSTAADRPAQAAAAACAAGEEAPDDRGKVPGVTPVTADGKTKKYGAENESREKPRLAKRTKQSAPAGRSLRVRGQTSGEPVVLNFDRTRAELELVAPASNCCINVLTPVRPSQRGKCGRSRANTANAGAALAASCEDRFLKPQIITAQRKWKVRAGRTLSLCIKFVGTPDPSVCWVKAGGAGTLPPELIMEEHIKGNTSIFFPAAKRSESGTYELRLKNNVGETEGHFEVLVQDRPAPPKRPLAVDNVARDSCTLSWQPPEDDGGSEVTNYVVECRDVGSQVWLPVNNVVGTNSTVPNLQEGHEYQFRVCAVNAFGCSDPLNTDSAVLAMDPYDPPGRPTVTDHDNNQISIKWAPSTDTGGSPIAHYDVQRKDAKTQRWIKVNTHPVYNCAYTDERVQPEHGYYYRVVAVNEAGLDKPSDQSELAWAKPKFETSRFELDDINGKEVRVLAGHANTRQYIPKSARSDSGQCRIVATNEKGTAETRGLISVVDRPGPPEGPITYPATTKHSITLSWRPPKDDGGTELSSYRIEFKGLDERDWERVPDHVTLPNYTVRNLEKGAQYQFRVFAENMVGISEPLNGEPVTAKDPFDTPKAQRTRSATIQRKSRRLAPVECAASAAQTADKPLAQNTSEERRTTRSAGTGAAPLAAPLTSPRQRVVNAVNGASSLHRLLSLCDNREVATWDQIGTFSETKKVGEGSYCEVFSTKNHGDVVVMKVVPFQFDGQRRESINGTGAQPSSSMVHHELLLTKQLSLLSQPNEQHMAASFLQLVGAFVVKGKLPQQIVAAWDYFKTNNDEKAQNRHPDRYVNDEQPFMVMYLNFAGTDLEDFIKKNNSQNTATRRRSIFRQIRLALAIAENVYNLEHRDLHLSNVLVVKFGQTKQLRFKLNGQLIEEETDVKVTIIDYGLSRIEIDGKPYFRQLEGIFEGVGGHSDVYRRMAVATGHKWDQSWPITNTLIGALSRTKTILEVSGEGSERGRTGPKEMNGDGRVVKNGDGRGAKEVNGDGVLLANNKQPPKFFNKLLKENAIIIFSDANNYNNNCDDNNGDNSRSFHHRSPQRHSQKQLFLCSV
ncbi:hypothetical protein niasHS_004696 [Heterodera schachtii]|uniref:Uncharacterized protein n=1 Tax=Heterodera schachtii TaxID=97005 RepID=A0ABD2JUP3_HETSC